MNVMDMTPEALFDLLDPLRVSGQLGSPHVKRCPMRDCHLIGHYEFRGTPVTIVTKLKLSPAKAEELGAPRRLPGRAWIGEAPAGTVYGCDHQIHVA